VQPKSPSRFTFPSAAAPSASWRPVRSPARERASGAVSLRHGTPRRNLGSILRTGLRPDRARGKLKAVWLHTRARTDWAVTHVADRHGYEEEDIIVLEVELPRSAVRRACRGIWICREVISPLCVVGINGLRVFAG
jgi:RNA:NAD 2'-phosphotransferase (TPT1/KptA family)